MTPVGERRVADTVPNASSLVTSREATCAGFLAQAKVKGQRTSPYVKEATRLWDILQKASSVDDVIEFVPMKTLATAVGFSDKAQWYFTDDELRESIRAVLNTIRKQADAHFREEILYRYLLTRGDTLGGEMRNITGALAQGKFTNALVQVLRSRGTSVQHERRGDKITYIAWDERLILFDRTPRLVGKNIDVILLKRTDRRPARELLEDPSLYIACGELKGGIDPAGADEHWKTARSALGRIRERFPRDCQKLFFAGAAIVPSMADEIFEQLQNGELTRAANLTVDAQVQELVAWLVSL